MPARPLRVFFNGDCNYLFADDYRRDPSKPDPYTTQVLDDHVDLLARSGVEAYLINVNGQVPWYPSRRLPDMLAGYRRGDRDYVLGHYPPTGPDFTAAQLEAALKTHLAMLDRYVDLREQGVNWFAHMIASCRKRGVSPWASVRMNDAHGANSWENSYFNCPPQKDPRMRLTGKPLNPKSPPVSYMTVCDYGHAQVRDYYFTMIAELIEEYDIDGLEFDWLRSTACCEPPASRKTTDKITAWHGSIRKLADKFARRRRRPIRLLLRVTPDIDKLLTIGLDVRALCRSGIVDYVSLSNFWQTSWDLPYDRLRRAVGEKVKILGCVEDAPNWMFARDRATGKSYYRLLSASAPLVRGNAAGKLACGADGVEFFNYFCTDSPLHRRGEKPGGADYAAIHRAADLDFLRGKPKHYALATQFNYWSDRFFESADQIPATVEFGGYRRFEIAMCAEPGRQLKQLLVQLILDADAPAEALGVSVNGCWPSFDAVPTDELLFPTGAFTHHIPEHRALNYRFDPALLCDGLNNIFVYHGQDALPPHDHARHPGVRVIGVEAGVM